jgi:hypothetical protein
MYSQRGFLSRQSFGVVRILPPQPSCPSEPSRIIQNLISALSLFGVKARVLKVVDCTQLLLSPSRGRWNA